MSLPFGLQLKSLIVGALLWAFVIPWVMGMVSSLRGGGEKS